MSNPVSQWTPSDFVTVISALGSVVVAIIAALRGTAAQSQSTANAASLNRMAAHLQNHDQQITLLALHQPAPDSADPAAPAAGTGDLDPLTVTNPAAASAQIAPQPGDEDRPQ